MRTCSRFYTLLTSIYKFINMCVLANEIVKIAGSFWKFFSVISSRILCWIMWENAEGKSSGRINRMKIKLKIEIVK